MKIWNHRNMVDLARRMPAVPPTLQVALGFLLLYALFDVLSLRYAGSSPGVTLWNPAAGLGFAMVAHFGRSLAPAVFFTTVLSNTIIRGPGETLTFALAEGIMVGAIYAVGALFLALPQMKFDARLQSLRDLMLLLAVAVGSSAIASLAYATVLLLTAGYRHDIGSVVIGYWIADLIGISIVAPLGLLALQRRIGLTLSSRGFMQFCLTLLLLVIAMRFREYGRFPYFYFLFFPVIWVALIAGIEGTVLVLAGIQVGMLVSVLVLEMGYLDVTDFQARMVSLVGTGLVAGALMTERTVVAERARLQQEALAQIATRGGMGELAAAIAHEVNQPLSAAGTYAALVAESLAAEPHKDPTVLDNVRKIVRQIDRSSQVIKRLRALVKLSRDDQMPVAIERILDEVRELSQSEAARAGIDIRVQMDGPLPQLRVDRLQIEQALLNMTRNSLEAIGMQAGADHSVTLYARQASNRAIEVGVVDTGPGFARDFSLERLEPFKSQKEDGLGVGLPLCRSIAIANGAELRIERTDKGAHVCLVFDPARTVTDE